MQLVVEAAGVADRVAVGVAAPQRGGGGVLVQLRNLVNNSKNYKRKDEGYTDL